MIEKYKNKILNNIKENRWVYLSFLVSLVCICIIYTVKQIRPFGDNSMLDVDFYHQYGPLLNELYERVKSGESLIYSFNTGGGIPFYRNFLNYLSSPFNILLFLFKKENIIMAFSIIIGLKAVTSSLTFAYYLKNSFKKYNGYFITIFSVLYAFSGYFCAYYWNIMWLDGMVFLPLIMLGINKLVDEEKPLFYCFSLAVMLFANYFIGYMICIFSVLYFIGYLTYKYKFKIKIILKKVLLFGSFSLLAGMLVSFALLPLFYSLSSISATSDSFPELSTSFSILNYLFNHISFVNRTVFASDELPLPNVYPGLITLIFILSFFLNKKINIRAKILSGIAIIVFLMSFIVNDIDFIWHAFHVPNDLPYRYSFIYVFVLEVIGFYGAIRYKEDSKLKYNISFAIIILFILLSIKLSFVNLSTEKAIICLIVILAYYLCFILFSSKKIPKKLVYLFIISVAGFEGIYGITSNWTIDHNIDVFMENRDKIKLLINEANTYDNDLYRIEKTDYLTLNDPAWFDYSGISTFSSMAYESVSKFQRNFGLSGNNINSYYYRSYNSPVYNTLFNIRYIIGNNIDNDYYTQIDRKGYYDLIKYKYSTSISYGLDKNIKKIKTEPFNAFNNQINFINLSTGLDNVYEEIKITEEENITFEDFNFSNNVNTNGEFYYSAIANNISLYLDNPKKQNIYLYVGGGNVESFEVDGKYYYITSDEYYIVDIGKKDIGKVKVNINLKSTDNNFLKFYAYSINDEQFQTFYNLINNNKLNVKKYSDTKIEGIVNLSDDKTMFTSVAYDSGWSVYVDDKKVKTFMIDDAYLAFDVKKGKHKVVLKYYPKKMKLGIILTILSIIILYIYYVKSDKYVKNN